MVPGPNSISSTVTLTAGRLSVPVPPGFEVGGDCGVCGAATAGADTRQAAVAETATITSGCRERGERDLRNKSDIAGTSLENASTGISMRAVIADAQDGRSGTSLSASSIEDIAVDVDCADSQ
jgi:hypothetical protein